MDFFTTVDIPHATEEIGYHDKLLLTGSCFADNMAGKLSEAFFQVSVNPFGTLYNPLSIIRCLSLLLQTADSDATTVAQQLPVFCHNGLWHSLLHHGTFSSPSEDTLRHLVAESLRKGAKALLHADVLILTFGSAWVYEYEGAVTGNCHRLPANLFHRRRLGVEEIAEACRSVLTTPALQQKRIIFTVSPIRHRKDGFHANALSKSTLLLAIDTLLSETKEPHAEWAYFPAYELMTDELRDYRFYADDMLHPSAQAVEYIWQRFCNTWLSASTRAEMQSLLNLRKMLNHRPLHPEGAEYEAFRRRTEEALREAQTHYPWITP